MIDVAKLRFKAEASSNVPRTGFEHRVSTSLVRKSSSSTRPTRLPAEIEAMTTPGPNSTPPSTETALSKTLDSLYGRINYERQTKVPPDGFRLDKMRELLNRLGNPQSSYPAIHVAGTKGKGSVSTMVGSILTASSFRTGVYTSPHLEKINQRMAIDGVQITDAQLLDRSDADAARD